MDPYSVIAATQTGVNFPMYLDALANTILPDLLKITFELLVLPVIGLAAREAAHRFSKWYLKFLVKWAGQKVERGIVGWAEKRMKLVLEAAEGKWWMKWLNRSDLEKMIEEAVVEWKMEYQAAIGKSQ